MKHDIVGDYVHVLDEHMRLMLSVDSSIAEYLINLGAQAQQDNYEFISMRGDHWVEFRDIDPLQVLKDTAS